MTEAFVLGGVRTPFTRYGGSLSHIRLDDLLGMAMKGACERVGVGLDEIEDIVAGCVNPAHEIERPDLRVVEGGRAGTKEPTSY